MPSVNWSGELDSTQLNREHIESTNGKQVRYISLQRCIQKIPLDIRQNKLHR